MYLRHTHGRTRWKAEGTSYIALGLASSNVAWLCRRTGGDYSCIWYISTRPHNQFFLRSSIEKIQEGPLNCYVLDLNLCTEAWRLRHILVCGRITYDVLLCPFSVTVTWPTRLDLNLAILTPSHRWTIGRGHIPTVLEVIYRRYWPLKKPFFF
jgi:hypothetical protein